jgi:hypothetical protein
MPVTVLRGLLKIEDEKIHARSLAKTHLRFKGRIRWNILINVIVLGIMAIPFVTPLLVTFIVNCYFMFIWIIFILCATIKHFRIHKTMNRYDKLSRISASENDGKDRVISSKYKFIMSTFAYKEPLGLIIKNLNNISTLYGSEDVVLTVCLEERTPDLGILSFLFC